MASKKATKSTKKSAKSTAAKPAKRTKAKAPPRALTAAEKNRLVKPLTEWPNLVERLVKTWRSHGKLVRVPGITAAKLASLMRAAQRANEREDALRAKLEAQLAPLADARLRAEHEVWKAALDVYAMVKSASRTDPSIAAPFDFFSAAMSPKKKAKRSDERAPTP